MTTPQKPADRLFEKAFLTFRNTLGGAAGPVPPIVPLPHAPQLVTPVDYEAVAMLYSNRYRGAFILNFSLGFLAVLLALIPLSGVLSEHTLHAIALYLTLAEVACIVVIMLIHWYGRDPVAYNGTAGSRVLRRLGLTNINQGWRQQWGHARLAAEHMRYIDLILGFPGIQLHDEGILEQAGEAHRETAATLRALGEQCPTAPANDAYIDTYLVHFLSVIRNQRAYHNNNAHRYHRIHHRLHQTASWSFYLTLLACGMHLFLHHPLLSALAALLPALAATCHGLLAAGEFNKLAEQWHTMAHALAKLEQEVASAGTSLAVLEQQVRTFLGLVVQDAIGWHVTLRDKDVQVT